jgi:hypothetical protein
VPERKVAAGIDALHRLLHTKQNIEDVLLAAYKTKHIQQVHLSCLLHAKQNIEDSCAAGSHCTQTLFAARTTMRMSQQCGRSTTLLQSHA